MPTIIKKGTNPSAFRLRNGRTIILRVGPGGGEMMNVLTDREYDELMAEYGKFILERRITDKNPNGTFIIHDSREYAEDMAKEIGDEIQDGSARIKVTQKKKKK